MKTLSPRRGRFENGTLVLLSYKGTKNPLCIQIQDAKGRNIPFTPLFTDERKTVSKESASLGLDLYDSVAKLSEQIQRGLKRIAIMGNLYLYEVIS